MAHTLELTSTILLSGTVTICYRTHIFVKDAVACFQLDFNIFSCSICIFCKLVFSIDAFEILQACLLVPTASCGNLCDEVFSTGLC